MPEENFFKPLEDVHYNSGKKIVYYTQVYTNSTSCFAGFTAKMRKSKYNKRESCQLVN
jgi:hypothetical protein